MKNINTTFQVLVCCLVIMSSFSASANCDTVGVTFTTSSNELRVSVQNIGIVDSIYYDYGDGSGISSYSQHTYSTEGTYTVCVTEYNDCDTVTACEPVTVFCDSIELDYTITKNAFAVQIKNYGKYGPMEYDYGEGNGTTNSNSYQYSTTGTYTVSITEYNACGAWATAQEVLTVSDSICDNDSIVVDFNLVSNELNVNVQNIGTVDSIFYDYGDGSQISDYSYHSYASAGTYTVCVSEYNDCGDTVTLCKPTTIGCDSIEIDYSLYKNGLTVQFQHHGQYESIHYDYGDGSGTTNANPYQYSTAGTYTVSITGYNACGQSATDFEVVTVTDTSSSCDSVTVDFTLSSYGLSVQVNNYGFVDSIVYDYGDSSGLSSTNMHTYASAGTYTITVTEYDSCGQSATGIKLVTVSELACPTPSPLFTSSVNKLSVTLFNNAQVGTIYFDYGDGSAVNYSSQYTYSSPGSYMICAYQWNNCGDTSSFCTTVTVRLNPCDSIEVDFDVDINNLTAEVFNNTTADSIVYDFGDSTGISYMNTHSYSTAGTYTVCVTMYNECGESARACEVITVGTNANQSQIILNPNGNGSNDSVVLLNGSKVYDKNGILVFEVKNGDELWSGINNSNQPLANGYYTVAEDNGNVYHITIIR